MLTGASSDTTPPAAHMCILMGVCLGAVCERAVWVRCSDNGTSRGGQERAPPWKRGGAEAGAGAGDEGLLGDGMCEMVGSSLHGS